MIREMPQWEKPREKLLRGGQEILSNSEILALIIRTGTKDKSALQLAEELLSIDPSGLRFLAECTPEELKSISGLGDAKVCEILAAVELGKRIASMPHPERNIIKCSDDIASLFMEKMRYLKREHFICILVNAKGEIIEEHQVSVGDLSSSTTHPREVFIKAIRRSAGSVAFVHNHPSGDPWPSEADIETTKRLIDVGKLLGIPVLDHIIIGDGTFCSMKAQGLI